MARKTIVALYDQRSEAETVRRELLDAGFDDLTVDVVFDGGFGGANDGHGGLWSLLTGWGVPDGEAHDYAEAVRLGGALVVVSLTRVDAVERALAILEPDGARAGNLGPAAAAMRSVNTGAATAPPSTAVEAKRGETVRAGVYPAPDAEPGAPGERRIQP
ncbi:hypothetical protein [Azospirillum rugosum]|uniref:Heat induced stress protein YflT n=1 Tax=Azospirillum rugosum TaxID=416170 RepID=A0ABS4SKT0_9PROT|nr:hypothetical protein [Azospirillum rugosum]MBP2293163.1 hypothetical protein [Azospirillum rugosum]MDQ0526712.1 hypothetical protein [Azospirillum rugosum]